jgi:hypothetical protein
VITIRSAVDIAHRSSKHHATRRQLPFSMLRVRDVRLPDSVSENRPDTGQGDQRPWVVGRDPTQRSQVARTDRAQGSASPTVDPMPGFKEWV